MEELTKEQIEALQVAADYSDKIVVAIGRIEKEFQEEKLPDTDAYMESIVKGLNWIFNIYGSTKYLFIQRGSAIDKDKVNTSVMLLNEAMQKNDDEKKVEALRGILDFVQIFAKEARAMIA